MTGYIALPIKRDPADAEATMLEVMRRQYPGWAAADGDPLTFALRSVAVLYGETAELAVSMAEEAFRYFGRGVADVPPTEPTLAVGVATITAQDADGPYVVPDGLEVAGRDETGTARGFRTVGAAVIPNGSTSIDVPVEASEEGEAWNGISGAGELSEFIDYLLPDVTFVGLTTGGTDREDDEPFLDRLREELRLLSPRPIRPEDFEVLARRFGAWRATAIDGLHPDDATDGSWSLALAGSGVQTFRLGVVITASDLGETDLLPWDVTADAVTAALEALVGAGNVTVTGGPGGTAPLVITLTGTLIGTPAAMTVTEHTATTAALTIVTVGDPGPMDAAATIALALIDEAGDELPDLEAVAIGDALEGMREVGWRVAIVRPTRTPIDVSFEFTPWPGWDPEVVRVAAVGAVAAFLSPARWGLRDDTGEDREWLNEGTVRRGDVLAAIMRVEGVRSVDLDTLGIARSGDGLGPDAVTMPGFAPLPVPGLIVGAVAA